MSYALGTGPLHDNDMRVPAGALLDWGVYAHAQPPVRFARNGLEGRLELLA
jgi:hypothetical protein